MFFSTLLCCFPKIDPKKNVGIWFLCWIISIIIYVSFLYSLNILYNYESITHLLGCMFNYYYYYYLRRDYMYMCDKECVRLVLHYIYMSKSKETICFSLCFVYVYLCVYVLFFAASAIIIWWPEFLLWSVIFYHLLLFEYLHFKIK